MPSNSPAVVVAGTGMYVCGRGTSSFGTVLPTLVQAQAEGMIGPIMVAGRTLESINILRAKLGQLEQVIGTHAAVELYPSERRSDSGYRQALADAPKPACAIVAVPDHLHAQAAGEAIRAGMHTLVVKPLTPTLAEARKLIDMAQTYRVHGATDFHKRFDEANLALREAIGSGKLGALRYITVEFSQRKMVRRAFESWVKHTNIFQYLGVHYVDLIYFLTGAAPVRVLATGQPRAALRDGLWTLDAIQAVIEWDLGGGQEFQSTVLTNWIDPDKASGFSEQRILVVGTEGRFDSDQKKRGVQIVTDASGIEEPNVYFSHLTRGAGGAWSMEGYGPRSIRQFLADARSLIDGQCQPAELVSQRPSFQDSLVSTAVIEAVNRSLVEGEAWVQVEDVRRAAKVPVQAGVAG